MQAQSPPRQGPQAGLAGTGARPHTPGAPSGSRPGSLDASSRRLRRSVLLVTAALVAASWIDEVLDFPHLLFGAPATPMNWRECLIETSLALAVGLIVWAVLSRVLLRARQDDQERKRGKILSDILINESPMMFTAINPDGTILLMSGYALEKLGYREEEVIGKSYLSLFVPPREREEMEKRLGELFGTGIPARGENYFVAKDGRELLLQWEARVVYKENGEVDFVYGPGVDVTEQKTLEVALRKSEERYRTFIQNLQGIAYQEDLEFTTLLIHGDVEEITGYAAEDFTSGAVRIIDILHPEDAEVITPHVEKLGTVPHYSTEMVYRIIRKDGQVRWIRDSISNACVENGMPASIQGIAYDITKEHEAKEALRRSEEIYRLLAENATVVIWATDRELKLTYISPSSEKVNGYTPEELMSLPPSALYTEVSYPVFLGYTSQVLAWMEEGFVPEDKRTLVVEAQRYRKDGSTIWVEIMANVVLDEKGRPSGVVGVTRDITERKKAEDALRASEERYRLLADNIRDVIWVMDKEFRFIYMSPSVQKLRGYTPEEAMALPVEKMFPKRSLEVMTRIRAEEEARMVKGISPADNWVRTYEVELVRKDGSIVPAEVIANDYFDGAGNHVGFVGVTRDISGRKAAEEALRKNEAMYRLLAENAYDVIWATDKDFRFTYVSPSSEKLSGYTAEETRRQEFGEPYTKESREQFLNYVSKAKTWFEQGYVPEGEGAQVLEAQRYHKDGSLLWVEIIAHVLFDEKGKPAGLVGVTRDITERKRAQEALRQSEEKYRLLAENTTDVIWACDTRFNYTYISPTAEKTLGSTPEEIMSQPFASAYTRESFEEIRKIVSRIMSWFADGHVPEDGRTLVFEGDRYRKDGSVIRVETTANILFDEEGKPAGLVGVTRDITARRKAEISLQQSETRYRLLTEHIKDVIFALDLDFRYTYISPYVETMRGFTQEEAMAMPWEEVVTTRSLPVLRKWFAYAERMLRTEEHPIRDAFSTFEVEMTCKDGSAIWTEVTVSLMYEADNKPYGYVGITRNISERKKAEEDLLRSEERYRLLAENINDVIWAMDPNFRYTYISPSVEKMRGYTVEEAMSLPMSKAYSRGSYKFMEKILAEGLARQQRGERPIPDDSTTFEVEMNCKDGSTKWVEVTANTVFGQDGSLSGFVGVTRDISERRKAEESMRKSEERYRLLADNVNDVIWAMDRTLALSYISPSVEKLSGYTAEEVMVLPIEKVFTERSFAKLSRILDKSAEMIAKGEKPEGDSALTLNLEFIHKDGSSKWVEVKSTFILDEAGRPVGGVGVARDITERKRQEEALRRSEETYRTIFESTGTAMVTIMEDGILSLVNEEFEVLSGYPRQEIEGRMHWRAFVAPEDQERLDRYRRARIASGDAPKSYEFRIIDREGTVKDVSVTATIFPGTERILMSLQDITQSKLAAEELKHSREQLRNLLKHSQDVRERERTRVAREIHDELGQVLTGLKMDLSFLAKKLPENLSELRTKTNLMLRFVDMTIQSVKRITMDLRPGLLDHLGLVAAIEWQAEEFQKRTGIRYRINVTPEDLSLGSEHSTAVFRIFQETLTNISKYAHATEVKISLAERAGVFEMNVSDNGVGITREQMENPKSFGLMGIQERAYFSGGRARIFGQKGKGTTVKVTIPLDQMRSIDDTSAYRG